MAGFIRLRTTHTHPYSDTKNTYLSLSQTRIPCKSSHSNNARKKMASHTVSYRVEGSFVQLVESMNFSMQQDWGASSA